MLAETLGSSQTVQEELLPHLVLFNHVVLKGRVGGELCCYMLYPENCHLICRVGAKILPSSKMGNLFWYFGK